LRGREHITDEALDFRQCLSEAGYVILNKRRQQLHEDHSTNDPSVFGLGDWQLLECLSLFSAA
jgi:hypothetical protein